jgi:hypothetical protein
MAINTSVVYIIVGILIGIYVNVSCVLCKQTTRKEEIIPLQRTMKRTMIMMPMHQPSQRTDDFMRIGHLYSGARILPLFGRLVHRGSHMWHYYTMSDGPIPVRLSFQNGGRHCDTEYGCGEIYDGDSIFITEYNTVFTASIVKNNYLRYNPNGF